MLNTNVRIGGSSFNYNVNMVSGTIRKSHPKSHIITDTLDSNLLRHTPEAWTGYTYKYKPAIVLQTMLCGNDKVIIEYVLEEDFLEGEE